MAGDESRSGVCSTGTWVPPHATEVLFRNGLITFAASLFNCSTPVAAILPWARRRYAPTEALVEKLFRETSALYKRGHSMLHLATCDGPVIRMRKPKTLAALCSPRAPENRGQPDVIVDFLFEQGLFHVMVANIGDVPACSVSVKFDKPFRGLGGATDVSALALFRQISFLAPHKRIETFLDTSSAYFQRREPTRITALISFRDTQRCSYERRITHDLGIYKDVTYLLKPGKLDSSRIYSASAEITPLTGESQYGSPQRKTLF
jgi:hypothetical protein